jgi:hypothetical protein
MSSSNDDRDFNYLGRGGHQWRFKTKPFNVPIVVPLSLSRQKSRSSTSPKDIPMSPSDVQPAGKQGRQSAMEVAERDQDSKDRCSRRNALNVGKIPKSHLSPGEINRYIAATAIVK